jgi:hypothetical protein
MSVGWWWVDYFFRGYTTLLYIGDYHHPWTGNEVLYQRVFHGMTLALNTAQGQVGLRNLGGWICLYIVGWVISQLTYLSFGGTIPPKTGKQSTMEIEACGTRWYHQDMWSGPTKHGHDFFGVPVALFFQQRIQGTHFGNRSFLQSGTMNEIGSSALKVSFFFHFLEHCRILGDRMATMKIKESPWKRPCFLGLSHWKTALVCCFYPLDMAD